MPDTQRVFLLNWVSYEKYQSDIKGAVPYARQALALAKKHDFYGGMINSYLYLSYISRAAGNNELALAQVDSAEHLCDTDGNEFLKVKTYNQKGNIYGDLGDVAKSLDFYIRASKVAEKYKDRRTLLGAYGNIGISFMSTRQYGKSKEYMRKAIAIAAELGEFKNEGNISNNIGAIYLEEHKDDSALIYFKRGEELFTRGNYKRGLAYCKYYLGYIYKRKKNYAMALLNFEKAASIFKESGTTTELPNMYNSIAEIYLLEELPYKALEYGKLSLEEAQKEGSYLDQKEAYMILKSAYEKTGDYKTALFYYGKFVTIKDSLFNSESTQQMAEMQTKYETEKKETENKLLIEKNESNDKVIRQQRYFGIAVGFICVLLIVFAIYFFRSNKQKQRTNIELERKNHLIEKQKELVEEKQKEILDSIHYARRIQRSLLTSEKYIARTINKLKTT